MLVPSFLGNGFYVKGVEEDSVQPLMDNTTEPHGFICGIYLACSSNGFRIAPSQGADVEFESHTGDLFQLEHLCTLSLFSPHGEISPVRQAIKPPALQSN